jgi:hypothetical protein
MGIVRAGCRGRAHRATATRRPGLFQRRTARPPFRMGPLSCAQIPRLATAGAALADAACQRAKGSGSRPRAAPRPRRRDGGGAVLRARSRRSAHRSVLAALPTRLARRFMRAGIKHHICGGGEPHRCQAARSRHAMAGRGVALVAQGPTAARAPAGMAHAYRGARGAPERGCALMRKCIPSWRDPTL